MNKKNIIAIQVRSAISSRPDISNTLKSLHMGKVHSGILLITNDNIIGGMLEKVKEYVTWGEITDILSEQVIEKRATLKKKTTEKTIYKLRMSPPVHGFKGGIKSVYKSGKKTGTLGPRGQDIEELIKRMI